MNKLIQNIKNSILNEQWKSYVIFSGGTYVIVENYGKFQKRLFSFSNFARFPIQLKGKTWPTSEHYYQAQKFEGTAHEETVRTAKNAWWAAKYGRELASLPDDWDERRLEVMIDAVQAKFKQHPQLKKLLLDTGNAILIEKTKQDNFWADGGDGSGQNFLGKILMMVREELKQSEHQNNATTPRLLFLDDLRNPADCLNYISNRKNVDISIYQKEWHIVRTYAEFITWIETHGLPDFISFDHDLADFYDENTIEYTGMDCAKWLVEYCMDNSLPCPDFVVHSANPSGADNIAALLNNFTKMRAKS